MGYEIKFDFKYQLEKGVEKSAVIILDEYEHLHAYHLNIQAMQKSDYQNYIDYLKCNKDIPHNWEEAIKQSQEKEYLTAALSIAVDQLLESLSNEDGCMKITNSPNGYETIEMKVTAYVAKHITAKGSALHQRMRTYPHYNNTEFKIFSLCV